MQSDVWEVLIMVTHYGGNFAQSANTINGWLRDFLWAQSSQVIQSYGSALSAYGLIFLEPTLSGHLALCSYSQDVDTGRSLLNQSYGRTTT